MPRGSDAGDCGEEAKKRTSDALLSEGSLSMRAQFESQTENFFSPSSRRDFRRTSSLGGAQDPGSWRRRSISLSRDGSNGSFEDIPSEVVAQVGDSGDRMLDGTVGNAMADSLDELYGTHPRRYSSSSHRGSWRKGSIRLSHDLEDGILEDAENGFSAKVGDSGDQVVRENLFDEQGSLMLEQDTFTISEKGVVPIPDGRSPLALEKPSLPIDSILYAEEKISTLIVQPVQVCYENVDHPTFVW